MKATEILEDIFSNRITVVSIANEVIPCVEGEAAIMCGKHNFDIQLIVGEDGRLTLFDRNKNEVRNIYDREIISESTPIYDVFEMLAETEFLLIKEKRKITRIVTRADLDSIPVRIWIYGNISLLEVNLRNKIKEMNIEWQPHLSIGRLNKASELFNFKQKDNSEIELLDCIQFADYGTIVRKEFSKLDSYFNCQRDQIESYFKKLRIVRDSISHSEKIQSDWSETFELLRFAKFTVDQL